MGGRRRGAGAAMTGGREVEEGSGGSCSLSIPVPGSTALPEAVQVWFTLLNILGLVWRVLRVEGGPEKLKEMSCV